MVAFSREEAARKECVYGMLPLHVACRNSCRNMPVEDIAKLLELYPQATAVRDCSGNLPIYYYTIEHFQMNGDEENRYQQGLKLLLKHTLEHVDIVSLCENVYWMNERN